MNTVKEVLTAALARMNDGGKHWGKGDYRKYDFASGETVYCSVGAIQWVVRDAIGHNQAGSDLQDRSVEALADVIPRNYFPGERSWKRVVVWNDADDTTWEDVTRVFAEAKEKVGDG